MNCKGRDSGSIVLGWLTKLIVVLLLAVSSSSTASRWVSLA